jgi:tungstate transport system ATP-binding protein
VNCFTLEGVTKECSGRRVLDIPSLAIAEGEICALLGPNGAGKTTLLTLLAHLEKPSTGSILYRGQAPPRSEAERRKLRREIVMVAQDPVMFSSSVHSNMEFGLKVRKTERSERERKIAAALELVGMQDFASAPAHRLSGGETRRVALARALALSPRVLLCDEPTSNVDAENQAIVLDILRQANRESKATVVFTSHDRSRAEHLAGRLITLDRGKVTEGVYENVFSAKVRREGGSSVRCILHGGISFAAALPGNVRPGRRARILVDPEKIQIGNGTVPEKGENVFRGRVRQVAELNGRVRITVDGGLLFTVFLADEDYRKHPAPVGGRVSFSVPREAIRFLV